MRFLYLVLCSVIILQTDCGGKDAQPGLPFERGGIGY
jgi:hypothetical protein